jgi:glycosyltransferase involved in cell wall biosynthesis
VPSLETPGWIEQFGRVAVEAMAAGTPVVASDSGSLAEVVGDAGILVPPGNPAALAAALARLAESPGERNRLAARARRRAERWSWPVIACRQAELYRRVMA